MDTPEEMRRKEVNRLYAKIAEHEQLEQGYIENTKKLVAALEATQRIVVSQQRQLNRQAIYAASAQDRITELEQAIENGRKEHQRERLSELQSIAIDHAKDMNVLYEQIDAFRQALAFYHPSHPLVKPSSINEAMERIIPKD